jgi:hypothetical protein
MCKPELCWRIPILYIYISRAVCEKTYLCVYNLRDEKGKQAVLEETYNASFSSNTSVNIVRLEENW